MTALEIWIAVGCAVLGAALAPVFERMLGKNDGSAVRIGGNNFATVHVGDNRITTKIIQNIRIEVQPAPIPAAPPGRPRRTTSQTIDSNSPEPDGNSVVGIGFLILLACSLVAWLYARYEEPILTVLFMIVLFTTAFFLSAIVFLLARRSKFSAGVLVQILVLASVIVTAFVCVSFSRNPPAFHGQGSTYAQVLADIRSQDFNSFMSSLKYDKMGAIVYQVLGGAITAMLSLYVLFATLKLVAVGTLASTVAAGNLPSTGFWTSFAVSKPKVISMVFGAVLIAASAVFVTTGIAYNLVSAHSNSPVPSKTPRTTALKTRPQATSTTKKKALTTTHPQPTTRAPATTISHPKTSPHLTTSR